MNRVTGRIIYELKRTRRRRSLAIRIEPNGHVTVMAPPFALTYFIDRFVQQHTEWIRKKLDEVEEFKKANPPKAFVSGETFPVWGTDRPLKIVTIPGADRPSCELLDGELRVSIQAQNGSRLVIPVQDLLREWYAMQTDEKLREVLPKWADVMGVAPKNVKVANQRKRWGSCSRKGNLRFNWRLSMLPASILDYVVVHELAHLRAHDHSKRFWGVVHGALPDFKDRRRSLREKGRYLFL